MPGGRPPPPPQRVIEELMLNILNTKIENEEVGEVGEVA
jgi:hypothetical protein